MRIEPIGFYGNTSINYFFRIRTNSKRREQVNIQQEKNEKPEREERITQAINLIAKEFSGTPLSYDAGCGDIHPYYFTFDKRI